MLKKIIIVSLLVLSMLVGTTQLWAGDGGTLTPGEPIQGEISERDEQDIYTFEGVGGDSVMITVTAAPDSSLDTVLELYDPAGELLDTNDDTPFEDGSTNSALRVTLPEDGEYRVVVLGFAGVSTGGYEILLQTAEDTLPPQTDEPEDLIIELGSARRASLGPGEIDTWSFTAPDDIYVQITAFSTEFDTMIELYDADGILLESDDDSGGGFNASINGVALEAGAEYEIQASPFEPEASGDYVITIDITQPPPETVTIAYGDSFDSLVIPGKPTNFVFEGAQNDVVSITMNGDFDGYLTVLDDGGIILTEDDDSGGDLQPAISSMVLPQDGTYTIEVTGYGNFDAGDFTLELELLDDAVTVEGGLVVYGDTVSGFANGDNPPNYTFEGSAGDRINVSVNADFDGVLELYDPSGELIASDDDGGSGVNPRLTLITLPVSGEYRLVLATFDPVETGAYTLTLSTGDDDARIIAMNSSAEQTLEAGGVAAFIFEASAGEVISVAVQSDFDPLLELRSASGAVIAQDDDSGGDLQPALNAITLPENGEYVVLVTGYDVSDEGPFTLTLNAGASVAGPQDVDAEPIAYGDIISGEIESGAVERFEFTGRQGDVISVAVDSEFDGILDIYGPAGDLVASDDDSGFNLNPLIEDLQLPADGNYRIDLGIFSGAAGGAFEIALILERAGDGDVVVTTDEMQIAYGEMVGGELTTSEATEFVFNAESGDTVTISVEADFDALIEIFDADGNLIAGDDDSGDGLNPLIEELTLDTAGTYTISVTSFDGQGRGEFAISLDAEMDEVEVVARVIIPGERVHEALEVNTSDTYVFNASAGDMVSISAAATEPGSALDLYIELYAPDSSLLVADDDSGWQFNPALVGVELPEEGTYRLEVQSFAGASSGDYVLALESGAVHIAPSGEMAQTLPTDSGSAAISIDLSAGESQAFVFSAAEGESLTVTSTASDLTVDLYSPSGLDQPLVSGEAATLAANDTYVIVLFASADTTDELQVILGEMVHELVIIEQGEIAADVPIRGTLGENEIQTWTFVPVMGGDYTFSLSSEDAE